MPNEFKVKNGLLVDAGGAQITGSLFVTGGLALNTSGTIFTTNSFTVLSVDGASGRLFQIDDSLSGSLFSVNTVAGLPVIEAFSDNTVRIGKYGQKVLYVSQSSVGINKEAALNGVLDISGSANITGSLSISGSFAVYTENGTELQATSAGIKIGNTITDIHSITGSLNISGSITGSLFGTSSWASNAVTASYSTRPDAYLIFAVSDESTTLTTGTNILTFRVPYALYLTQIPRASLTSGSTSGVVTVDINQNGTSILGVNKLSIDANQKTSTTATTPTTLGTTSIADDAEITVDIDAAGTNATGLKVTLYYVKQ